MKNNLLKLYYMIKTIIIGITKFYDADISPKKVRLGERYKTKVKFKGRVRNGFFDNYVKHLDSKWDTWNWDNNTLKDSAHTTAGELHGDVDIESEYEWSTENWPKGKFKIYVRLYDHITPGEIGRVRLLEKVHYLEVM